MAVRSRRWEGIVPPRVTWIRSKIGKIKGRLRVLIYARYSTDEQDPSSIEDQVAYCKRFLAALGVVDYEIFVLFDEGVSGESLYRDGISRVLAGLVDGQWDLILVEDCGRLYRNAHACMELAFTAVDHEVRLICINDEVDTAEEEFWEDRLYEAARHHQRSNKFTSLRIKRKLEALWLMGAAIGLLKPGYRRKASLPAADGERAQGPFFDEIDPELVPYIVGAYERIAALESPQTVADWLTQVKLPKTSNSRYPAWTARNVIDLIHRTDYRGVQTLRKRVSKRKRKSGRKQTRKNAPEQILTRLMPLLRIVPDCLWYAANRAIDNRAPKIDVPQGDDHPLAGIPRNSRGALSQVFVCGCCEGNMHAEVRSEGGYRCSNVRRRRCWNKATALRDVAHDAIAKALVENLHSLRNEAGGLASRAAMLLGDEGQRDARRLELQEEERELKTVVQTLNDALEIKSGPPPESTLERISRREHELAVVQAELEGLATQTERFTPPTEEEIIQRINELIPRLEGGMDRKVSDDLALLVGQIRAVPYQQFNSNKVVLRARFELRVAALLPTRTRAALVGLLNISLHDSFERVAIVVDLFRPTTGPEYGLAAWKLQEVDRLGPTEIGERLSITKRQACIARDYGKALREAGLTDAYIELTAPPAAASRWKTRPGDDSSEQLAAG